MAGCSVKRQEKEGGKKKKNYRKALRNKGSE